MNRPFIHINCASTMDGKIAKPDGSRLRISGPVDMERVHKLRAELGAILVGAGTIIMDDPKLTVKEKFTPDPPAIDKIVIDGAGRIPISSRFLRTEGRSIIITSAQFDDGWMDELEHAAEDEDLDIEIMVVEGEGTRIDIARAMNALHEIGIEKVLVEGGSEIIWEFVENGLFDRFTIYFGPMFIGGSGPTIMNGSGTMDPIDIKFIKNDMTPDGGLLVELGKAQ